MKEEFICQHDLDNPDHLICELKNSSAHRAVEIFLAIGLIMMLTVGVTILVKGRGVDKGVLAGLPESTLGTRSGMIGDKGESSTSPRSSSTRFDSTLEETTPAGLRVSSGGPLPNLQLGGELNESPQYSGQSYLSLAAEARYYSVEGEQLGRGPWPPKAGEATKVKVFLKLIAGGPSSDASEDGPQNIIVTASLAPNVQWTGFAPIGTGLAYEPETRAIRWIIKEIPANAVFEVEIKPLARQITEKQVLILQDIRMKGLDKILQIPHVVITWE